MYIKEPRKVKLKPINYVCEWVPKCNFEVQEYSEFYSHVITHLSDIRGVKNECSLSKYFDAPIFLYPKKYMGHLLKYAILLIRDGKISAAYSLHKLKVR